jgi:hypothetical protein
MRGIILIPLVILFASLSLLSLISTIIGLIGKRRRLRTISLIALLCCLCLCSLTTLYAGKVAASRAFTVARAFPEKAESVFKGVFIWGVELVWGDDRSDLLDSKTPNPQIQLLRSYVPPDVLATINPEYYTYFGFRDWWRFPLVYPYSIHTIDMVDWGFLYDDSRVVDYRSGTDASTSTGISGIRQLALDRNYLLLKTQKELWKEDSEIQFVIFKFSTQEKWTFDSEDRMFEKVKSLGFQGDLRLMTLREYDALFWK